MRIQHLFFSLLSLILGFSFFVGGGFLLFVPQVPVLNMKARELIERSNFFSASGLAMMCIGLLTLTIFGILSKRRYYFIRMGQVAIHENVIKAIVKKSLEELFPGKGVDCDVIIRKKENLEILAKIPSLLNQEEGVYEKLEETLVLALSKCGIQREFLLNVQFS